MGKLPVGLTRILPLCALFFILPSLIRPDITFAQQLSAAINWNVTFNSTSSLPYVQAFAFIFPAADKDTITKEVQAAGQAWSQYLNVPGSITINVNIDLNPDSNSPRAATSPYTSTNTVPRNILDPLKDKPGALSDPKNGKQIADSYAAYKLRTGKVPPGASADTTDINIALNSQAWANSSHDLTKPGMEDNAVAVFAHEIGHAIAFDGFEDPNDPYESPFDEHVSINGTTLGFDGETARFVYGSVVPLQEDQVQHQLKGWDKVLTTTASTEKGGNMLFFYNGTSGIVPGMGAMGTNIPENTIVTDVTSDTVILSKPVTDPISLDAHIAFGLVSPVLRDDLMSDSQPFVGRNYWAGENFPVSNLDLAILRDCGLPVDAPIVTAAKGLVNASGNNRVPFSSLFSARDPDGEAITWYTVRDITADPNTGHFSVPNGSYTFDSNNQPVAVSGDRPAGEQDSVPASAFAQVSFVTGSVSGSSELWYAAFDGHTWSAPEHLTFQTSAGSSLAR